MATALRSRPETEAAQIPEFELELPEAFEDLLRRARYKGWWGGRGGGKTQQFAGVLVMLAFSYLAVPGCGRWFEAGDPAIKVAEKKYGKKARGLRILCCREIQLSIADSSKQVLDDKIDDMGMRWFFRSTEKEIRGLNGCRFFFHGLRHNIGNIKSKEGIDIVWVDEAQSVSQGSLDKLIPTIRKPGSELWFSWNPDQPTDPIDVLLRAEDVPEPDPSLMGDYETWQIVRKANWWDNPWFPDNLRIEMETMRRRDLDIWLGEYEQLSEARVFKNVRVESPAVVAAARKKAARFYFGADFGFSIDPTVLSRMFLVGRTLYIDREAYEVGCSIDHIPFLWGGVKDEQLNAMNAQGFAALSAKQKREYRGIEGARAWPIIADSSDPQTIDYLVRHGFPKVKGALKGANSIEEGITFLQSLDIVISEDCPFTIDEFTSFSYKVDKKTKEILPVLEEKKNHVIDAVRYAIEPTRRAQAGTAAVGGLH
jgi:phage terminase large subunit